MPNDETALRHAIEQLYFGYRAFTAPPDKILAQRGLSRGHHRILYFVGRNPGISVNTLLATLDISKQALNTPLRQLIEMQLVDMSTADHDKRIRQLSLTPSGAKLEALLTGTQMKLLQSAFEQAGSNAVNGWLTIMHNLSSKN